MTRKSAEFITLCNKNLMVSDIEDINKTTHVKHADCNIFIVAERNRYNYDHHPKCKSIFDKFKSILDDSSNPDSIDIMIDTMNTQRNMKDVKQLKGNIFFTKSDIQPTWVSELTKYSPGSLRWVKNPKITKHITQENDIDKMEENPLFMKLHRKMKQQSLVWQDTVVTMSKWVVDFALVSRIVTMKLKNVIIYTDLKHHDQLITILNDLKYKRNRTVKGKCSLTRTILGPPNPLGPPSLIELEN